MFSKPSYAVRFFQKSRLVSPARGLYHLVTVFALFIFAEEAQYNLVRNVRLKNSETGVLGTRKIGTREYCCVTRVQF